MDRKTDGSRVGTGKTMPISERYLHLAEQPLPERDRKRLGFRRGATWGDALPMQQFKAALMGRVAAAQEIREAIEGKSGNGVYRTADQQMEVRVRFEDVVNKLLND